MKLPFRLPARSARRTPATARLLPALMATLAAVLGLKAVAFAEDAAQTVAAAPQAAPAEPAPDAAAPAAGQCAPPTFAEQAGLSQAEVQVLQALGARRTALDARAGEIDTSTELLSAAEQRLDARLAELRRLETSVSGLLGQLDEQQATRMANLVDVYQRMRAKDAAAVFDALDDDTLLLVASRMRQQNLAEVMGRMDTARARRLTQMLAELSRRTQDGEALLAQNAAAPPRTGGTPARAPTPAATGGAAPTQPAANAAR